MTSSGVPVALRSAANTFADLYGDRLHDPDFVRDSCMQISEAFAQSCTRHGVEAAVINGMKFGETPAFPGVRLALQGHFAVQVGDQVYDWTARQFDPDAPVPLVVPVTQWRTEWPPLSARGTPHGR